MKCNPLFCCVVPVFMAAVLCGVCFAEKPMEQVPSEPTVSESDQDDRKTTTSSEESLSSETAPNAVDSELTNLLEQLRKTYGDEKFLSILLSTTNMIIPNANRLVHKSDMIGILLFSLILLGAVAGLTLYRKKKDLSLSRLGKNHKRKDRGNSDSLESDIPEGWVNWFEGIDRDQIKELTKREVDYVTQSFFEQLSEVTLSGKSPEDGEIEVAQSKTVQELREFVTSGEWLEMINNGPLIAEKRGFLSTHLRQFFPTLKFPEWLKEESEIQAIPMAVLGVIGMMIGCFVGNIIPRVLNLAPGMSMIYGGLIGCFCFIWGGFYLARHDQALKKVMKLVAILAIVDIIIQVIKGFIPFSFLSSFSLVSFTTCMVGGGTFLSALFCIKRNTITARARGDFDRELRHAVETWLDTMVSVTLLLTRRSNFPEDPLNEGAKEAQKMTKQTVSLIQSYHKTLQMIADGNDPMPGLEEMKQIFSTVGFNCKSLSEFQDESGLVWEDSFNEKYRVIGEIHPGDPIVVQQEPVIRGETVVEKGYAQKKRPLKSCPSK